MLASAGEIGNLSLFYREAAGTSTGRFGAFRWSRSIGLELGIIICLQLVCSGRREIPIASFLLGCVAETSRSSDLTVPAPTQSNASIASASAGPPNNSTAATDPGAKTEWGRTLTNELNCFRDHFITDEGGDAATATQMKYNETQHALRFVLRGAAGHLHH